MSSQRLTRIGLAVAIAAAGAVTYGTVVSASHAWNNYHWARTTSPFTLTIVNSTTSDWDSYVTQAVGDWSASSVLNMVEDISGSTSNKDRRKCNSPDGMVRICNNTYGPTGWLGVAGISVDADNHITTGYTKLNDTYFNTAYYNTAPWKQSVTCQELGHNVGLGHQDEVFNNQSLFSCMDYQDPPYEYPNAHDYQQLAAIYGHNDDYDSYAGGGSSDPPDGGGGTCNAPQGKGCNKARGGQGNAEIGWGISLGRRGNHETFIRIDPDGTRHITHVTWVDGH